MAPTRRLLLLALVLASPYLADPTPPAEEEQQMLLTGPEDHMEGLVETAGRVRRQARGNRPGIFGLLFQLIAETQNDTQSAYRQIVQVLDRNVVDGNSIVNSTAAFTDGSDASTTEAPLRITRQDLLRVLRRNLRGLSRLFNREVDMAVQQSNRNVAQARTDFREALRPFLAPANITAPTTTTRRP